MLPLHSASTCRARPQTRYSEGVGVGSVGAISSECFWKLLRTAAWFQEEEEEKEEFINVKMKFQDFERRYEQKDSASHFNARKYEISVAP